MTTTEFNTSESTGVPTSVVGFGIAEIAYILRDFSGDQRQRAMDLLRLNPDYVTEEIGVAGASSLVAHGFADALSENEIQLTGPAQLLAYACEHGERWTTVTSIDGDRSDVAMHLRAPETSALLQPRGMGTWWAVFRLPEGDDVDLLKLVIDGYTRPEPDVAVAFTAETLTGSRTLFVRKTAADPGWGIAWVLPDATVADNREVDEAGLRGALHTLLTESFGPEES